MATESKNPWESFECDLSAENFNEPQELFNNIKLNHFPFLKRHFPFVDYLVKCKLCDVILLPQTLVSHYENRHGNSTDPDTQKNTELLPYQAVSCYNDKIDTHVKKERTISKRSRNISRRTKRTAPPIEREVGSLETISETDSLSSLTDDNLKRQPVTFSEDDVEHLREPVLLKLAKSECNPNGITAMREVLPKTDPDGKTPHGDRSVWSVVYSKESLGPQTSQKSRTKSQVNWGHSPGNTPQDSGCGTQSVDPVSRTSGATTHRASSYPPTPAFSPHPSSPTPSNVSDGAVFVLGKGRTEQIDRSRSRSTHSSSSSTSILNDQREVYDNSNSSPWRYPDSYGPPLDRKRKTGPGGRVHSRARRAQAVITSQLELPDSPISQTYPLSARIEAGDIEVDPYMNQFEFQDTKDIELNERLCQPDRFISNFHALSHPPKRATLRNGYHGWMRQFRGNRTTTLVSRDGGIVRSGFYPSHRADWRRVSGLSSELPYTEPATGCSSWGELPQPSSSSRRSRGSLQTATESDKSGRVNSGTLLGTGNEHSEGRQDSTFDPLTQCGCIIVGNLRCRSSLLCPLHTIEEKCLIPRQRDVRQLILEARERLQLPKPLSGAMNHRSVGRSVPNADLYSPVIDLTDDVSGSESLDDSMESVEAVNNMRMNTLSSDLHPGCRNVFRGARTLDAQAIYHNHMRRRTKLPQSVGTPVGELSHIPQRIARRVVARNNSHLIQPGVPYSVGLNALGEPITTVCPNVTVDPSGAGSGEPFLTLRHGSIPTDSSYLSDTASLSGLDLSATSYPARLVAISGRSGSSLPANSSQPRKPIRLPPQLRRAQPVGLQSFPPQWSAGTSDLTCDPMLSHTSPSLSDPSLSVPLDEGDPCDVVDHLLPRELMAVPGLSVDGSGSDASFHGRLIPASTPIVLSSAPVTQLSYDSHAMLERQATHSTPLVNPSVSVNRFARSVFGGAQVVRESQGRVVVDDIREKSITGRSRKAARSSFRHVTPVFPSSNFTGMFHPRYQYSPSQATNVVTATTTTSAAAAGSAFIAGALKPNTVPSVPASVASHARTAVFARPVAGTSSDVCLTSNMSAGLPTLSATTEAGLSVIRRSSLVSRPLLKSSSSRFLANGPCLDPDLNPYHPASIVDPLSATASTSSSEPIDLDSCIQASNVVHATAETSYNASSGCVMNEPNSGSSSCSLPYGVTQTQRASTLSACTNSFVPTEIPNTMLCRNRYFVIRPGTVPKGSTNLVVRARRAETGSVYSPVDDSACQAPSTVQQQMQQQSTQPPPPSEAS